MNVFLFYKSVAGKGLWRGVFGFVLWSLVIKESQEYFIDRMDYNSA